MVKENRRFEARFQPGWIDLSWRIFKAKIGAFLCEIAAFLAIAACGTIQHIPVETNTEVNIKDSTVFHVIDSIRVTEATKYKDMAWLGDTLSIQGARSKMWAYADTTKEAIVGGLEEDETQEKTRIVFKDRVVYKDSLVYKEVPVPVEVTKEKVPAWSWWTLGICVFSLDWGIWRVKKRFF